MIEQLNTRLQQYGITKQQAAGILARGSIGHGNKRIWVDVAPQDEQAVGGFKRVEMMLEGIGGNFKRVRA